MTHLCIYAIGPCGFKHKFSSGSTKGKPNHGASSAATEPIGDKDAWVLEGTQNFAYLVSSPALVVTNIT